MYNPVYLPDSTIIFTYGDGLASKLRGFDMCLDPTDVPNLEAALAELGIAPTNVIMAPPWQGGSFSGGPDKGNVPYLQFGPSAVPVLAGVVAGFFYNAGGHIAGTPFEAALRAFVARSQPTQA
jgi:hypothetical protein